LDHSAVDRPWFQVERLTSCPIDPDIEVGSFDPAGHCIQACNRRELLSHTRRRASLGYVTVRAHAEPSSSVSASDADLLCNFDRIVALDADGSQHRLSYGAR